MTDFVTPDFSSGDRAHSKNLNAVGMVHPVTNIDRADGTFPFLLSLKSRVTRLGMPIGTFECHPFLPQENKRWCVVRNGWVSTLNISFAFT